MLALDFVARMAGIPILQTMKVSEILVLQDFIDNEVLFSFHKVINATIGNNFSSS
ncbi:MAG: hypothetical protein MJK14_19585 [Rivularia sp. ALOHA_DT_140]|nr:hypothetical protein [Rivularia sp. ALOHA_DT_140]